MGLGLRRPDAPACQVREGDGPWFERLRTMANTHATEIDEWSRRVGRPVRVPRIIFPWPSAAIWDGLLAEGVEAPQLVLDDDPNRPGG
jgi:hypothetical protein